MKKTITLLLILIASTIVKADCLACWELRKVEITLTNGEIMTGFVRWNESWVVLLEDWKVWKNNFPQSLIHYHKSIPNNQDILVLTKLTNVKNDSLFEFKATTEKDQFIIRPEEIDRIVEIDEESKRYQSAGGIPVYTETELETLNKNPYAAYHKDIGVADVYFLSYNKRINKQMLQEYSKSEYWTKKDELSMKGVIIVILSYD
jgi:hypothetical protein